MRTWKAHCLVLPYPLQGHINPMIQFSMRLQHEGIKVTLAATESLSNTLQEVSCSIPVETISDGYVEIENKLDDLGLYFDTFERVGSVSLSELLSKLQDLGRSVDCIVFDAVLPWALEVAKKFGISAAAFYTQSCAVNSIYYHVQKGLLKLPLVEDVVNLPGLPPLATSDFPSFVADYGSYPPIFRLLVNQFLNIEQADWLFFNTFYELEDEGFNSMNRSLPVRAIGPTIPSMYLDKRLQGNTEYGLNIFQPITDACMTWLNTKSEDSIAYVSFGSLVALNSEQMEELAWGLRNSNKNFLWVVRKSEENKLPEGFIEETSETGLVVTWCPQLQILAHKAISCFVTHCGWNSTLEALSLGVPMVAMPQWTDQSTNAKLVMDVWKMGIKAQSDENGIVRRDEIEKCVRQVTEGERGKEFKRNGAKWMELARKAVSERGSSDQNIKEFVNSLVPDSRNVQELQVRFPSSHRPLGH